MKATPVAEFDTHSWLSFMLRFSPDGKTLVATTREKVGATLIDTSKWKVRKILPEMQSAPSWIEFSGDSGLLIISTGRESPLYCWDVATGAVKWSIKPGSMHSVFSPDDKVIAATRMKSVILCDARDGKIMHEMKGHSSRVDFTSFSKDGKQLVTAGGSEMIVWDIKTATQIEVLQKKKGIVTRAEFSPDGKWLANVSGGGAVRFFDIRSGYKLVSQPEHDDDAFDLAFTPDSKRLATVSFDATIRLWEVPSGRELLKIDLPEGVSPGRLELSPDGRIVVVPLGDTVRAVGLWDTETGGELDRIEITRTAGKPPYEYPAAPEDIAVSPDGKWLAIASSDGKTEIWPLKRGKD